MNDSIILRHILEGLIHNLNNPLNLILGYSQRLKQVRKDCSEAEKIYRAGIEIDDMIKEVVQKLWDNSFDIKQKLNLIEWLEGELKYLRHHLPIKHQIVFQRVDTVDDARVMASPLQLAAWYESSLFVFLKAAPELKIITGVCRHADALALYIMPREPENISAEALFSGFSEGESSILEEKSIETAWDYDSKCLYGICL